MYRLIIACLFLSLSRSYTFAQNDNLFWTEVENKELEDLSTIKDRPLPNKFLAFNLNGSALQEKLAAAPLSFSDDDPIPVIISLPLPNHTFEEFIVEETPIMDTDLANQFPNFKTYTARSRKRFAVTAKLDLTPHGFHAMILSPNESTVYIDPYFNEQETYLSYFSKDYPNTEGSFECHFEEDGHLTDAPDNIGRAGDCSYRQYRLALACTGEYAQFHDDGDDTNGDIISDVMAAMVTSMNRVNGVFEKDAGLTMIMVDNTSIIFTDAANDPYTNDDSFALLNENQTTCNNNIGFNNYDIGHVFSTGGGGVAWLQSPCSGNKARGVTGRGAPVGDPFDIDYVAHEMGHQYGGSHTQNNGCNRSSSSSFEPGSASTIMGYAGICDPNIQDNSDDYFHARSIIQFGSFTTNNGNCANILSSSNSQPTANAGSNYTIPISTPFVLSGTATDSENDPVSYCWEQYNNQVATMPPSPTSTSGPNFRSLDPTTSPDRYFPNLPSLIGSNDSNTWEILPSVSRTMTFKLTVRDNNTTYGCTDDDNMFVTTSTAAGPFEITFPNAAENFEVDQPVTVTWNVANTDNAPVNCSLVDLFYSTDGGQTFNNILATGVPNDGSHVVIMPNISSTGFSIMVKCSDNIFFDVSNSLSSVGILCAAETSPDAAQSISASGTPIVTSSLTIGNIGTIVDLDVVNLEGTHTFLANLDITLIGPDGTRVLLIDDACGNQNDFDVNFDDDGGSLNCPYNDNQTITPEESLSAFNNMSAQGTWILEIIDDTDNDGGQLVTWGLRICTSEELTPLPLELLSFSAKPLERDIRLDWETANEFNNKGFEIERSTNPIRGFNNIGNVNAVSDQTAGAYTFLDQDIKLNQLYYYRLKQIDFDGDFEYSEITSAIIRGHELKVTVSPNPATQNLNIQINNPNQKKGQYSIANSVGQKLITFQFDNQEQVNNSSDISNLAKGIYILTITLEDGKSESIRFVKK